ncbi:MAG: LpqB family beta-propeller domain-containing protein, partial [Blastocatellia bacterium]
RYQTVKELQIDLRRLKQRLDYKQYRKRGALTALTALLVVTLSVAFGLYKLIGPNQAGLAAPKFTRLTANGKAVAAAYSPNGKNIAYAMEEDGKQSLWLRQVAIHSSEPIAPAAAAQYSDLTFSRDGALLYYCVRDETDPALSGLYQIALPGRNPKRLIAGSVLNLALSPDGAQLAFVRRDSQTNAPLTLALANADGSNEQVLATRKLPDVFGPLAWAPDGEVIACVSVRNSANLVAVSLKGGAEKPMSAHQWSSITSVAWLADGSGVIVSALDRALGTNSQLWQISYPGAAERKLTNDLNDYQGSSLTADSGALVTLQESVSLYLWIMSKGEYARATQITPRTGKDDGQRGVAWTPDGRLIYTSTASGSPTLWMMNSDGGSQKQFTMTAGQNIRPTVSPDGRYLVFTFLHPGNRGNREVWRMNLDGSDPKLIAEDGGYPQCSPDGNWVVYELGPGGTWKAPSAGGSPIQLTDKPSFYLAISPDGKLVASFSRLAQRQITVIPFEGGSPIRLLDLPPTPGSFVPGLRWAPDGLALTYGITRSGVSNIWSMPLDGGPPKQLTDFKAEQIYAFDWSRDGRLVVSRGVATRDVVLISGFR